MQTIPLTRSATPMAFDALSAVKVRYFCGTPPRGSLYTLARLYLLGGALHWQLSAFEREPPPGSELRLCLAPAEAGPGALWLQALLTPGGFALTLMPGEKPLPAEAPRRISGADEQGWYWGAEGVLAAEALAAAGIRPEEVLRAALFKTDSGHSAWGASFKPPQPEAPYTPAAFPLCTAVDY